MIQNMKIGMNGSMLDEHPTGVGIYSINVINHFVELCKSDKGTTISVFSPTRSQLNKGIHIIRLSRFLKSSQYGRIAALARFLWNTLYYPIQARKFDLLLSTTTHGSFTLKNQVITIHDLLSLRFNNISPHQRFYYKYFLPYMVSKAKLIIAISETTKKDIIEFLGCPESKIKVIHNGYDESVYNDQPYNGHDIELKYGVKNYLLAIGPTYPHKNFELLIGVYVNFEEKVKQKFPLLIAGGKPKYLAALKSYVKEKRVEKFVHFLGYIPAPLMPALYKESYALVFPSLYEGFGFPLLEAMACGCPVVSSNVSSMPEVCEDAALYFDPYSAVDLTNKLKMLMNDNQLYVELKAKGLKQAKKFSWNKNVTALREAIKENIY